MDGLLFFGRYWLFVCGNAGLYVGLAFGLLILLRPATDRLFSPKQRTALWGILWIACFAPQFLLLFGMIPMPVSLRALVTARTWEEGSYYNIPMLLPEISGAGDYFLALPGDVGVPLHIPQWTADAIGVLGLAMTVLTLWTAFSQDGRVKRLCRGGRELERGDYERLDLTWSEEVRIKLCPDLPTSFVVRHLGWHQVVLQQELPPEQMKLVLLHEREHVRQHHPWLQSIATAAWSIYFWNPVIWAAYYLFRRDMELACDRGVMDGLDEQGRREYARTLVELASDRPVWGGLTSFGECDAALRVRRAVDWRPQRRGILRGLGWLGVLALGLFLVAGGPEDRVLSADILAVMDRENVWEQMAEYTQWDEDTVFYIKKADRYVSVRFQDRRGEWWQAFFRWKSYRDQDVDLHFNSGVGPPDMEEYRALNVKER